MSNRKLTPQDYIHKGIIEEVLAWGDVTLNCELTLENASEIYNNPEGYILDTDYPSDHIYDACDGYRSSGEECNILPKSYSRHYEVDYVVKEIDGKWVGWNYWYGGGKHAEPEAIDWIADAEFVKVQSEEVVTVVQRTFMREE